mgnify:CR=1 FL=1
MNYSLPPLLLTLAALAPLLRASLRRPAAPPADNQSEQRALIAAWREQSAADPANQDEHDYRLYHALKNLRDGKAARAARAPRWHIPAMLLASACALLLWQLADHANSRRWHDLTAQLAPVLQRSQYLGEIAQIPAESLTIYCQALQQRIDRNDPQQLATLARCYARDNQYRVAADIYARARRLNPGDDALALDYAQTRLFAHPGEAMPADVETILRAQSGQNPLAKILLAAGYTQSGKKNLAAPLWAELRRELAPDHPLYRLIPADSDAAEATAHAPTITVHIHPDTLASLPPTARLYVSASLPGERMPLAVRATAPALSQTLQLTDRDSMTGESLGSRPQLTYRAILSADGNVSGARLAEKEHTASGNATLTLELP